MSFKGKKNTNDEKSKENSSASVENLFNFTDSEKFIHEPLRLQMLAHLKAVRKVDMKFLQKELQVSWGNLSFHSTKLEEKGYIKIEKQFIGKKSYTLLTLTPLGKDAFDKYRIKMKKILF